MIRRFISQPTVKLLRKANADHPTPGVFHPPKASDNRPNGDPDNVTLRPGPPCDEMMYG
jgi:hypothetical protein